MALEAKKRILVVDDEPNWLITIKNVLQSDYTLTLETNPADALDSLKEAPVSLVILDMKFPDGTQGLDVFRQMRKITPDLRAIILTGFPDVDDAVKTFRMGFLDYLKKGSDNLFTELRERVREILDVDTEILDLVSKGESEELEFKSSARWDYRENRVNKVLEKVIVKTIAAFLNSKKGGVLLIGVDDSGQVVGLQQDYDSIAKKNRDGYESFLIDILLNATGKDSILFIQITFHQIQNKDVCRIAVKPSPKPVYVSEDKATHLYIRAGNSTRLLSTKEAVEYCRSRWEN
ncbi:MAG TPA: RNA-binding domain-containing protein [Pyrinomonadaceae bacterium]|nr:RNA-binding domain-containing protein [Pyrinomonadaceae bacterium]